MKGSDFLGGLLVGAVVGAVAGLLLAPQSGEETREYVRKQAGEIGDKVAEGSRQFAESSRDLLEQGKSQVVTAVQQARDAAMSLRPGATTDEAQQSEA